MTDEVKLSRAMQKGLDRLSIDYPMVVLDFSRRNSMLQANLFELILGFLNRWAMMHRDSMVRPGETMHRICEMSDRMLTALDTPAGRGKHSR